MCFCAAVGVPKKSGVARLFKVFATAVLANFQDRLVMTASISLHILFCRRALPDRLIIPHTGGDCQVYVKKRAGLPPFFLKNVHLSMM